MDKKSILAIVLSLIVWILWMNFVEQPVQQKKESTVIKEVNRKPETEKREKIAFNRPERKSKITLISSNNKIEKKIEMSTEQFKARFSNRGAIIESFKWRERDIELIVTNTNAKGFFDFPIHMSEEEFIWGSNLDKTLWNCKKISNNVISFSSRLSISGRPIKIEKIYTFYSNTHYFRIEYRLTNIGNRDFIFPNGYLLFSPADFLGPDMDFDNQYNHINSIYNLGGDFEKETKGGGFFSNGESIKKENGVTRWVGLMSRYFLLLMIPEKFDGTGIICDLQENSGSRTGIYIPADLIEVGGKIRKSFKVYVGIKDKERLAAVDSSISDAADISKWIEPIRDFVLWCLLKINILMGNYGWSLVIFSILSKLVLFPLTMKSTESMKKMQELSPIISELREKYKGKPEILNKKIMEIYKKNKVNPMSGCLPLLLQLPFFFALYSALINSVDLWRAPFILWIMDLSMPDTVYTFNNFNINILPIFMTLTTFIQQKLSSGSTMGQQQKIMMLMPLVFIVIFWNMPSGLVLYWTLQNLLQILHQVYINKKEDEVTV